MAKKTTYILITMVFITLLSGCIEVRDNGRNIFEDFKLQKKESVIRAESQSSTATAAQITTVDIHTQKRRCYKNIDCLEDSTFLYHFYATSANPEQHVKEIVGIHHKHEIHGGNMINESNRDEFKYRKLTRDYTPRIVNRINAASQKTTVSISIPLVLSIYDFNSQSFTYSLLKSANLSPLPIRDDYNYDPELYHMPIFFVNFTNKEVLSTLNMAEAEAAKLTTTRSSTEKYEKRSLKHRYVGPQIAYGNKKVMLKIKASLGKRSMTTLSDISKDKKEYKIEATDRKSVV